jgi:uncharacterized protein (UPF0335 family)
MFENDREKVRAIVKEKKGIALLSWIERLENGKYKLNITVSEVFDDLTRNIFKKISQDGKWKYEVRKVIQKGTNYFYEDVDNDEIEKTDTYEETFDTYEEAYSKLQEILSIVKDSRDKIRLAKREFSTYVII